MNAKDILKKFNVSDIDSKLRILCCSPDKIPNTDSFIWVSPSEVTNLPFEDQSFHLALCSDVLFQDGKHQTEDFHVRALEELMRVASEVRLLPLMSEGKPSKYLGPVLQKLQQEDLGVEVKEINSGEDQGHIPMLRLWNTSCATKHNEKESNL